MKTVDLHEEFVHALCARIPQRSNLINMIADVLKIEKESAYRRLSGKVNFSVREIGMIAKKFGISLDPMLYINAEYLWLPFLLKSPLKFHTIDSLIEIIESLLVQIEEIRECPTESGKVINSLPIEFYIQFPVLTKFMFFKWGHYFIGTEEYANFSEWEAPQRLDNIREKVKHTTRFDHIFYIWDNCLIWTLTTEIENFYKMHVITAEDKNIIRTELKELLNSLEKWLIKTSSPDEGETDRVHFYISSINMGFTSSYWSSSDTHIASFNTNFSASVINDSENSFIRIRDWIRSLRKMSILISDSGYIERRLFFEKQHKTIDQVLA